LDDLPVPLQEGQKIILYFSGLNCLFNFSFSLFIITAKKKSQIPLPPVNPLLPAGRSDWAGMPPKILSGG